MCVSLGEFLPRLMENSEECARRARKTSHIDRVQRGEEPRPPMTAHRLPRDLVRSVSRKSLRGGAGRGPPPCRGDRRSGLRGEDQGSAGSWGGSSSRASQAVRGRSKQPRGAPGGPDGRQAPGPGRRKTVGGTWWERVDALSKDRQEVPRETRKFLEHEADTGMWRGIDPG